MFYHKVTKISLVLKLLVCRSLFKITQFTQNLINIKYQNSVGCNHPIIADFFLQIYLTKYSKILLLKNMRVCIKQKYKF